MQLIYKNNSLKTGRFINTNTKKKTLFSQVVLFILITIIYIAFSGCTQSSKSLVFTEKDNGSMVSCTKDQELKIKLESNMTTGYSWNLSENTDEGIVMMVSSEYKESKKEKEMVGAGGTETFIFEAKDNGRTEILLEYKKPWEENTEPEKVFKITVTVN